MKIAGRVLLRVFAAFRGVKRARLCRALDFVPSEGTKNYVRATYAWQSNFVPSEGTKFEYLPTAKLVRVRLALRSNCGHLLLAGQ